MTITVKPVSSQTDWADFFSLPHKLYSSNPYWVPPEADSLEWRLNPRKNPFYQQAHSCPLIAYAGKEAVGRAAATIDKGHPWQDTGFFGFWETVDDPAVTHALITAAAAWLKTQGATKLVGPFSLTSNEEVGLLVEGFDQHPPVGLGYNHRYYDQHLTTQGLKKATDFLSYSCSTAITPPEKLLKVAQRAGRQVELLPLPQGSSRRATLAFQELYNQALASNWGFRPLTTAEAKAVLQGLAETGSNEFLLVALLEGHPVGLCLSLPDINPVRQRHGGHLPRNWAQGVTCLRLAVLGVIPAARRRGVEGLLLARTLELAQKHGFQELNLSVIWEENTAVNRLVAAFPTTKVIARYRVYGMDLG